MIIFSEDRSPGCGHFIREGDEVCLYCERKRRLARNEKKRKEWEAKQ